MLGLLRQRLCISFAPGDLKSLVLYSLFVIYSKGLHCGIAGPPKACRLTMGL